MDIFISSRMNDTFGPLREAASEAITQLGCKPVRVENYQASPVSPQTACLAEVRSADAVLLILGAEYGVPQASGLSATHEEYREARKMSRPVFIFIDETARPINQQEDFIQEVQNWECGQYTVSFMNAADLKTKIIQGLHRHLITRAMTPLNQDELRHRALEQITTRAHTGRQLLVVSIVGGPSQQVIRPAELENQQLSHYLQNEAHRSPGAVLSHSCATTTSVSGDTIILEQHDRGAYVTLSETGCITVSQPAVKYDTHRSDVHHFQTIIQEEVTELILNALRFGALVLDYVDKYQRISHVAVATAVLGAGHLPWRTQKEHELDPYSMTIGLSVKERVEATLFPPTRQRAALSNDAEHMSQDLAVNLRRNRQK